MDNVRTQSQAVRLILRSLVASLLLSATFTAQGAVISTQQALQAEAGVAAIERAQEKLQALLARDDARNALIAMGVDPESALARVATLTPDEAQQLAERLDQLPAGSTGVIEVVGIVVVVLLLLELLGVTNVFTNF